jgi:hypothetical protein
MHTFTDEEIIRVLHLTATIAAATFPKDIPALPDGFDGGQELKDARRRALPLDAMTELGAILNRE